jgi:hypothetical protein
MTCQMYRRLPSTAASRPVEVVRKATPGYVSRRIASSIRLRVSSLSSMWRRMASADRSSFTRFGALVFSRASRASAMYPGVYQRSTRLALSLRARCPGRSCLYLRDTL